MSVTNLLTTVVLDNVFFDVAPAWGNSSKAPFAGSPNFASFVIGPGGTRQGDDPRAEGARDSAASARESVLGRRTCERLA